MADFDFACHLRDVFFRTQQIKGTPLLQLVEAYRNKEGQPRQRMVASLGNANLPSGDPRCLAKAVEDQINGQTEGLGDSLTEETAAWVVHVASLAKRSKGATQVVSGTVIEPLISLSASSPITSCAGSDTGSPTATMCATGKRCVACCAPTAW